VICVIRVLDMLGVRGVHCWRGTAGAMLCMLGRSSLRRMLPHASGGSVVVVTTSGFRSLGRFSLRHVFCSRSVSVALVCVVFAGVRGWGLADFGFVACGVDGIDDLLVRYCSRDRHVGRFQGEIDAGFNAFKLAELPLNPIDARGAGHTLYVQFDDPGFGLIEGLLATQEDS
jgi:hypothetical protein